MFIPITSWVSLALIMATSCCFVLFGSPFAERSIQFSFLDFPIFIGEWLMAFSVVALIVHLLIVPVCWRGWRVVILVYFFWVMIKIYEGYTHGGAYALRNAALFYYPIFAVLTVHFLRKLKLCCSQWLILLATMSFMILAWISVQIPFILIAACFALNLSHRWIRRIVIVFLSGFFLYKCGELSSGRGCLMGIVTVIMFLVWYAGKMFQYSFLKIAGYIAIAGVFFGVYLWMSGDRNSVTSLITPARMVEGYQESERLVRQQKRSFESRSLKAQVYNKDAQADADQVATFFIKTAHKIESKVANVLQEISFHGRSPATTGISQLTTAPIAVLPTAAEQELTSQSAIPVAAVVAEEATMPVNTPASIVTQQVQEFPAQLAEPDQVVTFAAPEKVMMDMPRYSARLFRDLGGVYNNGAFRLFIWRDMVGEFLTYRPLFGFSFDHPQRSVSLEILHWGEGEWSRDGWIAPHNSFLHFIYRGGIVGVLIIVFIIGVVVVMIRNFLRAHSWQGGILVSTLIYWLMIAQFGVILELPYHAIPFWSLFGVAWFYSYNCREISQKKEG